MCQPCFDQNCKSCISGNECSICKADFILKDGFCANTCIKQNECRRSAFCDLNTKLCSRCVENCYKCLSKTICSACEGGLEVNILGVCSDPCNTAPIDGQYCKYGTPTVCEDGLTTKCICKTADNCASCSEDFTKCKTCLPGFKMENEACKECEKGYEKFEQLCVKVNSAKSASLSGGVVAGIVIASVAVIGAVAGGLVYYFMKKNKAGNVQLVSENSKVLSQQLKTE